ncbi:undecaprenyl-phosphate glucose phosphotransferase [Methylovorus sp. MM2]|uniref:undecaprenyl-phosphate glucose phosphotransferase n=1 Tax=Methylovorus sp. MM2 TaxID=1848038 RepID=UPI002696DA2D
MNDIPLVTFFKRLLDPLLILGLLYIFTAVNKQPFNGYYLILALLTYFVSSHVYEQINLYRTWRSGKVIAYIRDIAFGWVIVVGVIVIIGYASDIAVQYDEKVLVQWAIVAPIIIFFSHMLIRKIASDLHKNGALRSVIIVGANDLGHRIVERINDDPYLFMEVKGFFDDREVARLHQDTPRLLGRVADIAAYARKHNVDIIFVSLPISAQPRITKMFDELQDTTASIYFVPDIYIFDLVQARFDDVGGVPVVAICETPFTGYNTLVKRASDLVLATLILLLLLPLMLLIALAVKCTSPGNVIFKQRRYGLNGEEITVYKFRSMTVSEDGHQVVQAQKDDFRVTKVGAFLRKTSLDELPQFINVLQGRMSIVGPRPHAVAHNEQYRKLIKGYMLRHKVKPGITGWAQINGLRGETDRLEKMKERVEYDLDYLRNWSLPLDLWIIFRTVIVVLKRENAY